MSTPRFTEEFKIDAIKQITERGHSVVDVSHRLSVKSYSLYNWIKQYSPTDNSGHRDSLQRSNCRSKTVTRH